MNKKIKKVELDLSNLTNKNLFTIDLEEDIEINIFNKDNSDKFYLVINNAGNYSITWWNELNWIDQYGFNTTIHYFLKDYIVYLEFIYIENKWFGRFLNYEKTIKKDEYVTIKN